jgi:hypothetical protein
MSGPSTLPPGTPLPGGVGVAGTILATWTYPPHVLWAGWVATGEQPPVIEYSGPGWQSAFPMSIPPADAGPPPEGGGTYFQIMLLGLGGWIER